MRNTAELKSGLQEHLDVTNTQISRLETIFQSLNQSLRRNLQRYEGCHQGRRRDLLAGGDPATVDAGIVSAAQRVEHYEMAGYGTVRTYAKLLGQPEHANLLQQTLDEEEEAIASSPKSQNG